MAWWEYILFFLAVILAVWGFLSIVGFRTSTLTRRTSRRAEDLYDDYAGSPRQQRRYAREHGGEWHDQE